MKGTKVLLCAQPMGQFGEGFISGTPKPGTHLQIKAAVEPVGGRFTYEVYAPGTGDGTPAPIIVLLEDALQGKTYDDAYATGDRIQFYSPIAGEEMNVRKADISGTGSGLEDLSIGEKMAVVDGTGKVAPANALPGVAHANARYPWTCLETMVDQAAEVLIQAQYNP